MADKRIYYGGQAVIEGDDPRPQQYGNRPP
jgi:hypothetical protein